MENLKSIKQLLVQLIESTESKLIELQNIKIGITNVLSLDATSIDKNEEVIVIPKNSKD